MQQLDDATEADTRPDRGVAAALKRSGRAFTSLEEPRFRWWFVSQVLSSSGNMTQVAAMSWLVLSLTGSAVDLGLVSTATLLPILTGSALAGSLVDRFDRRRVLLVTQSLYIVIGALLATLTATDRIELWMILVLAFVTGSISAVDLPARQVFVLDLVGTARLASAVSLYEVVMNAARVIGPSVGGLLIALFGPAACFAFNAATYLLPLAVLLTIHVTHQARTVAEDRRTDPSAGVRAGVVYAFGQPVIRACLLLAVTGAMLFNPGLLYPLLSTQVFHLSAGAYGALMAAFGLGAIPGAVAAAGTRGEPSGRLVAVLAAATGVLMVPVALAPVVAVAVIATVALGFVSIWFIAAANTLVQLTSLPAMRGRVMGLWTVALPGTGLVTALAVGALADAAGTRVAFLAVGLSIIGSAAVGWRALSSHRPEVDRRSGVDGPTT